MTSAPCVHMLLQHELVVHFIDVIARQHDDVFGVVALDDVDVLINRVGGAEIPAVLGNALARGQDIEALVADGAQEVPAAQEMPDQAMRLVLRGDGDMPDARVEGVRQSEIDDARLARQSRPRASRARRSVPSGGCRGRRPEHRPSRGVLGEMFFVVSSVASH